MGILLCVEECIKHGGFVLPELRFLSPLAG